MDNEFHTTRPDTNVLGSRHSLSDDQSSLVDEGYWHDNDLVLAAELGKALLDRNRVLEQALEKARAIEEEKTAEVEFLLKQLTELRELSQRKAAFVDEADSYNMELDRNNRRLMQQMVADKQKISRLSSNVARLEQQVSDLLDQLAQRNTNGSELTARRAEIASIVAGRSPSPARSLSPVANATGLSFRRPRFGTARGQFIDDELVDQPQLSLVSTPMWTGHTTRYGYDSDVNATQLDRTSRVTSWPLLARSIQSALDVELFQAGAGDSTQSQRTLPIRASVSSTADVPKQASLPTMISPGSTNCNTTAAVRHCPRCGFQLEAANNATSEQPNNFANQANSGSPVAISDASTTRTINSSTASATACGPHLRELQDLLDDAAFIRRLESIYSLKLRCGVPSLTATDYQPQYKQLFRDAFRLLRDLKKGTKRSQLSVLKED